MKVDTDHNRYYVTKEVTERTPMFYVTSEIVLAEDLSMEEVIERYGHRDDVFVYEENSDLLEQQEARL